ncbi:hypothetical protein RA11412_0349 [Rothia aeria]|uniref:Uncharacterized protein n=1 Tax=Rothia aeria TaxID=172042 RepID=A0A2Z5QW69_9MICC|nr:hypothetical protein RA11412_0349 [Rothia aeria]
MTIDSGQTLGSSGLMPVDDTPSGSTGQGSSGSPISNSNTDPEGTGTGGGSGGGPGSEELQPDPDETHPDDFILDPGNEKQDPGGGGGGDDKQHHDPNQRNFDDQESNKGGGGVTTSLLNARTLRWNIRNSRSRTTANNKTAPRLLNASNSNSRLIREQGNKKITLSPSLMPSLNGING